MDPINMNVRRLILAAALVTTPAGTFLAGSAGADPAGESFEINCEELGTVEIVTPPGEGLWKPGLVTDSNQVVVPYRFHFEFTRTGGTTETFDAEKPTPRNGRLDVCTFSSTEPEGTFSGTAWISYMPAGR